MGRNLVRCLVITALAGAMIHAGSDGSGVERAEAAHRAASQELPDGVTAEMVELGEAVYNGDGFCMTCHGAQGEGTPIGPQLNNDEWIHIDGSFESIVEIVDSGVMQPAEHAGAMLPRGGGDVSDDELRAVSAYVWVLSQGG